MNGGPTRAHSGSIDGERLRSQAAPFSLDGCT